MFIYVKNKKEYLLFRIASRLIVGVLSFSLIFAPSAAHAQSINFLNLPVPGTLVQPTPAFAPVLLKGMTIHPDDPLKFDFIIDSGSGLLAEDEIKEESEKLLKYFLASMTIPKDDLWVNLSPYEQDRIVPEELGKTELGRDMLAQDYILKQLTASLMYPEEELGKRFWDKIYKKAGEEYGVSEIPVNTFNKVWIVPERATVYEHNQTVYITDTYLRVMLDSDYVAMKEGLGVRVQGVEDELNPTPYTLDPQLSHDLIREIILPEIEREVNQGEHFAPLRQIYHSLILAKWYKETMKASVGATGRSPLLLQIYADQNKIDGVNTDDPTIKDQIYERYIEAYKKGVFNYIKEDLDRLSREVIPRKYFSGGLGLDANIQIGHSSSPVIDPDNPQYRARVEVTAQGTGQSGLPVYQAEDVYWHIGLVLNDSADLEARKKSFAILKNLDDYEAKKIVAIADEIRERLDVEKYHYARDQIIELLPEAQKFRVLGHDFEIVHYQEERIFEFRGAETEEFLADVKSSAQLGPTGVREGMDEFGRKYSEYGNVIEIQNQDGEVSKREQVFRTYEPGWVWDVESPERLEIIQGELLDHSGPPTEPGARGEQNRTTSSPAAETVDRPSPSITDQLNFTQLKAFRAMTPNQRITFLRELRGFTREELEQRMGLDLRISVEAMEKDGARLYPRYIKRMADVLGVEPMEIYHGRTLEELIQNSLTLGERIRLLRMNAGWSQVEFAEMMGVSDAGVVSRWESDANRPKSDRILIRLATTLNVGVAVLLEGMSIDEALGKEKYRSFENRVRLLRLDHKLTREELARKLTLHPGTIYKLESGNLEPGPRLISDLINHLEVSAEILTGHKQNIPLSSSPVKRNTTALSKSGDAGHSLLRDMGLDFHLKLSTKWFMRGHPTKYYSGRQRSRDVAAAAYRFAKERGLRDDEARFLYQVGLLIDFDPRRKSDTPPRVPATLKVITDDFTRTRSLSGKAGTSTLQSTFGWSEREYLMAMAMIQRSEYSFHDLRRPKNSAYKEKFPVERYADYLEKLMKIDPGAVRFVLQEAPYLSEYADKANGLLIGGFTYNTNKLTDYVAEVNNAIGDTVTYRSYITNYFESFLSRQVGTENSFEYDIETAARFGFGDIEFLYRDEALKKMPESMAVRFRANVHAFKRMHMVHAQHKNDFNRIMKIGENAFLDYYFDIRNTASRDPGPGTTPSSSPVLDSDLVIPSGFAILMGIVYLIDRRNRIQDGTTRLMLAASKFKVKQVEFLIDRGADPNAVDENGQTALMHAVQSNFPEIFDSKLVAVMALVYNGADVTIKDKTGRTALDYAKDSQIREYLQEHMEEQKRDQDKSKETPSTIDESGSSEEADEPSSSPVVLRADNTEAINEAFLEDGTESLGKLVETTVHSQLDFLILLTNLSYMVAQEVRSNPQNARNILKDLREKFYDLDRMTRNDPDDKLSSIIKELLRLTRVVDEYTEFSDDGEVFYAQPYPTNIQPDTGELDVRQIRRHIELMLRRQNDNTFLLDTLREVAGDNDIIAEDIEGPIKVALFQQGGYQRVYLVMVPVRGRIIPFTLIVGRKPDDLSQVVRDDFKNLLKYKNDDRVLQKVMKLTTATYQGNDISAFSSHFYNQHGEIVFFIPSPHAMPVFPFRFGLNSLLTSYQKFFHKEYFDKLLAGIVRLYASFYLDDPQAQEMIDLKVSAGDVNIDERKFSNLHPDRWGEVLDFDDFKLIAWRNTLTDVDVPRFVSRLFSLHYLDYWKSEGMALENVKLNPHIVEPSAVYRGVVKGLRRVLTDKYGPREGLVKLQEWLRLYGEAVSTKKVPVNDMVSVEDLHRSIEELDRELRDGQGDSQEAISSPVNQIVDLNQVSPKSAIVVVDWNIGRDKETGDVTDLNAQRIRESLPSINAALTEIDNLQYLYLMTHSGRPVGYGFEEVLSMAPIIDRAREIIEQEGIDAELVSLPYALSEIPNAIARAKEAAENRKIIFIFENIRFYPQERSENASLRQMFENELLDLTGAEAYINEAFDKSHREKEASMEMVNLFDQNRRAAGNHLADKIEQFVAFEREVQHPMVVLAGGAKFDKYKQLAELVEAKFTKEDTLALLGALAYPWLVSEGQSVGDSLMPSKDDEMTIVQNAIKKIKEAQRQIGFEIIAPSDHIIKSNPAQPVEKIAAGEIAMDIGPETMDEISFVIDDIIHGKKGSVIMNGGAGVFTQEDFREGTITLVDLGSKVADLDLPVLAVGGDMNEALSIINADGIPVSEKIRKVTGGGVIFEVLVKGVQNVPAIAALIQSSPVEGPGTERMYGASSPVGKSDEQYFMPREASNENLRTSRILKRQEVVAKKHRFAVEYEALLEDQYQRMVWPNNFNLKTDLQSIDFDWNQRVDSPMGFDINDPQKEMLRKEVRRLINQNQESRQLVIYHFGIGITRFNAGNYLDEMNRPREVLDFTDEVFQVAVDEIDEDEVREWNIYIIALDRFKEHVDTANQYFEPTEQHYERMGGPHMHLQAIEANFLERSGLETVRDQLVFDEIQAQRADIIMHRNVTYVNYHAQDDHLLTVAGIGRPYGSLEIWESRYRSQTLNQYLQFNHIMNTFGKNGAIFVVEPVRASMLSESGQKIDRPHRYKRFEFEGGSQVDSSEYQSENKIFLPGIIRIDDYDKASRVTFLEFFEHIDKKRDKDPNIYRALEEEKPRAGSPVTGDEEAHEKNPEQVLEEFRQEAEDRGAIEAFNGIVQKYGREEFLEPETQKAYRQWIEAAGKKLRRDVLATRIGNFRLPHDIQAVLDSMKKEDRERFQSLKQIKERIIFLREWRDMTPEKLAQEAGVTLNTIESLEHGFKNLDSLVTMRLKPKTIRAIARGLKVQPIVFLAGQSLEYALRGIHSQGLKMRLARFSRGWTQKQLAEKLGVSADLVNDWENQFKKTGTDVELDPVYLSKLAQIFEVPVGAFSGTDGPVGSFADVDIPPGGEIKIKSAPNKDFNLTIDFRDHRKEGMLTRTWMNFRDIGHIWKDKSGFYADGYWAKDLIKLESNITYLFDAYGRDSSSFEADENVLEAELTDGYLRLKNIGKLDIPLYYYDHSYSSSPIEIIEQNPGGIDMNAIEVDRQGGGVDVQFDPVELQNIIDSNFTGFRPIIINFTPLPSVLPLLGLEPKRDEEFELSQVNKW